MRGRDEVGGERGGLKKNEDMRGDIQWEDEESAIGGYEKQETA